MIRFGRVLSAGCLLALVGLISAVPGPGAIEARASIYDSRVESRLTGLSPNQRNAVNRIVRQSDRELREVFRRYDIDPNGRPVFNKLWAASTELRSIERRERAAMKEILTPEQMEQYDAIIEETRIRVRAAAQ